MEQLTVSALPTSAGTARRYVSSFCQQQKLTRRVADDAVLLVSELASNAMLHAGSEARIRVALSGTVLRVEVADDSPELPRDRAAALDATGGRGVHILNQLSSRWGATRRTEPPPGKVVWFELSTS